MTFEEISHEWLELHKSVIGHSTYIGYENALNHIFKEIGGIEIDDIKYFNVQKVINCNVEKGYSKRTLLGLKNTMSIVFDFAIKNEYTSKNIVSLVTIPKNIKQKAKGCLTVKEVEIVLKFEHEYSQFVWLLYYTGMRRGEALALQWKDIDFNKSSININKSIEFINNKPIVKSTKTVNGNRIIPIPEPLLKILFDMKINSKSSNLFTQKTTGNIHTQTSYKKMWSRWETSLNEHLGGTKENPAIRHLTAHMFRHTYVTYLFENEVPDLIIQNIAGHSDIAFTRKQYTHLRDDFTEEKFKAIRSIF